jgi:collagenase-like PrtC family protease
VDRVYLGETACSHRSCFSPEFVTEILQELSRADKEVYASSVALVRDTAEHEVFEELAQCVRRVEINSPAFLGLARRYPAVGGMFLNVYNSATARLLAQHTIEGIVLPSELSLESVACIAGNCPTATEVLAYGHIPIAVSCECNSARALRRGAEQCEEPCRGYPEGLVLNAGGESMFRVEGQQVLSAATWCLVEDLHELERAGVDMVRILPRRNHTGRIAAIFREVLDRRRGPTDALRELEAISGGKLCNGWLFGKAGWSYESPN